MSENFRQVGSYDALRHGGGAVDALKSQHELVRELFGVREQLAAKFDNGELTDQEYLSKLADVERKLREASWEITSR